MSRTKISENLVRRDGLAPDLTFEDLCEILIAESKDVVKVALIRERAGEAADQWYSDALGALEVLGAPPEFIGDVRAEFDAKIANGFLRELPDQEETVEHQQEVAHVLVSAWLDLLRHGLENTEGSLPLRPEAMLPPMGAVSARFYSTFNAEIEPLAISREEAQHLLGRLGLRLFEGRSSLRLPSGIRLSRSSHNDETRIRAEREPAHA